MVFVCAVAVAFAVELVVFLRVGDEIVQRKPVMAPSRMNGGSSALGTYAPPGDPNCTNFSLMALLQAQEPRR